MKFRDIKEGEYFMKLPINNNEPNDVYKRIPLGKYIRVWCPQVKTDLKQEDEVIRIRI